MASTFSTSLRLELMGTGDQSGTWGVTSNVNFGSLLEEAIAGVGAITHDDSANYTLTTSNGASDEARNMTLVIGGTLTANRNVIVPDVDKFYLVNNATTGGFSLTVKTLSGTGVAITNGALAIVYCDAVNVDLGLGTLAAANSVATAAIQDDAVTNAKIGTDAVNADSIATNAVGADELADNAVDTAAIVNDAVTNDKIGTDAVNADSIATNAVGADELADNAVDTAAIVNDAVSLAKVATGTVRSVLAYDNTGNPVNPAAGTVGQVLTANASAAPTFQDPGGGGVPSAVIEDQKAQNTAGGTFSSGAWQTRDLNTEVYDPDSLISITSNEFTVVNDGWVEWEAPAAQVNRHQSRLFNVTNTVEVKSSITGYSEASVTSQTLSVGGARVEAGKTYRIEHQSQSSRSSDGFGNEANFTTEVYTRVKYWSD